MQHGLIRPSPRHLTEDLYILMHTTRLLHGTSAPILHHHHTAHGLSMFSVYARR
jgi:hypothetical protein